jgi:hypothetical protein
VVLDARESPVERREATVQARLPPFAGHPLLGRPGDELIYGSEPQLE